MSIVDVPRDPSVRIMKVANKLVLLFILMPLHQFILLIKKINEYNSLVGDSHSPEVRLTSPCKILLTGVRLGGWSGEECDAE